MTPDRRRVLKGMAAALAASGMTVAERRAAFATDEDKLRILARSVGQALAGAVNQYFGADHIDATAKHFTDLFGSDGADYQFGHWILKHDAYLGSPAPPAMNDARWQQLVDHDMEHDITAALTAAIRACLTAKPPTMISFVCDNDLSGSKYHVLTMSMSRKPDHFKGKEGAVISIKCNEG